MRIGLRSNIILFISIFLGVAAGGWNHPLIMSLADTLSKLFINYLSLIAAPIILLAIFSTLTGARLQQVRKMGKKILFYTLLTTILAASVALLIFLVIDPVLVKQEATSIDFVKEGSYIGFLVDIVPGNIFKAFAENKVISIAFLGFLFGISSHFIEEEAQASLRKGAEALFKLFLKLAELTTVIMPFVVWAFMALLMQEIREHKSEVNRLFLYLGVVILANLVQGIVIIPLLLKAKGLKPWHLAKKVHKALLVAFFTKSSNATLPVSLKVAKEGAGIEAEVAHFSLPLCTVINMNGCAAFILSTVLFVAGSNGCQFGVFDLMFWLFMAVIAAVGNAGVPMGCFFLSSAFLMSLNVPLTLMGLILPFYTLIDMEETALNVWSDLSVTAIVDQECKKQPALVEPV